MPRAAQSFSSKALRLTIPNSAMILSRGRPSPCKQARSRRTCRSLFAACMLIAGVLGLSPDALSEEERGRVMVQFAPTAIHYGTSSDYKGHSWLVGAEYLWPNRWLAGFSYFNNSFDQKCQYIYGGYSWVLHGDESRYWYLKLTGGAVIGYREPFENKIPFNNNGVAPGIIPGLGYQYDRFNVQLNVLGNAGLMVTVGYDVFR